MTKLPLIAAAAMVLAAPTFSTVARAEPAAGVKVAEVVVRHDEGWRRHHHHHCRSITTWRHGHRITVRRCD